MEAGWTMGGYFWSGTHWWRLFRTTCHIAPLWRMKTNPAVHVSECEGQQAHSHTWRGPCGGFSGENLWCQKAEVKCCDLVYLQTGGPLKPRALAHTSVTPDTVQVHCWGVGLLLWSASAWTECSSSSTYRYINISLLFSIYPSTPHRRTHFSA